MPIWCRHALLGLLVGLLVSWPMLNAALVAADSAEIAEAQTQVEQMLGPLGDSEAEIASGSYVPGVGAIFTLDLLRGPNTVEDRPPYAAVRDWSIYLLTTFGPTLTAIPPGESISIVVNYYDYSENAFHRITIRSSSAEISDPGSYAIWLDNLPYNEAVALREGAATDQSPTPVSTAEPLAPTATTQATTQPSPGELATPIPAAPADYATTFDSADAIAEWSVASGHWEWVDGAYEQNELGKFDLVSYSKRKITGDYRVTTRVKYIEGEMGAGIVFNGLDVSTKKGAQMVSFAGNGTFLQWGYFDADGIFQYEGGVPIKTTTADGEWHVLSVEVTGSTYLVSLDTVVLGEGLLSQQVSGGYAGLLVSTSRIQFDDLRIESVQP